VAFDASHKNSQPAPNRLNLSMNMTKQVYAHITRDRRISQGVPIISGTRIAVRTIAGYYQMGMDVDEILQSLPHLSQSQVHAGLSFYFDHQKEIDRDLKRNSDVTFWRKRVKSRSSITAKAA
jgi:uncharacterized protein (DUF433 family)